MRQADCMIDGRRQTDDRSLQSSEVPEQRLLMGGSLAMGRDSRPKRSRVRRIDTCRKCYLLPCCPVAAPVVLVGGFILLKWLVSAWMFVICCCWHGRLRPWAARWEIGTSSHRAFVNAPRENCAVGHKHQAQLLEITGQVHPLD